MKCKTCGKKIKLFKYPGEDEYVDMCDPCFLKDLDQYINATLKEMNKNE